LPDTTCFVLSRSTSARKVLNRTTADTERACEVACGEYSLCAAISYSGTDCLILATGNASVTCTSPTDVLRRTTAGCPSVPFPPSFASLSIDICVTGFNHDKLTLDTSGICPRNGSKYIVRGIDEFGGRITLDNDVSNVLTYNATRNMWMFYFSSTGFTKWLIAVSCA
ncbi:hypothetical protein PENTCL1PPCAC_14050, partial [Pristionchus entomophagus]